MLVPCDVFSNMIFSNAIFPNTIFSNPTFWNMICRKLTLTSLTCKHRGEAAASETSRSLAAPGWRGLLPVASVLFGMAIVGGLVLSPGEGSAQVSLGTPITLETSMADDPPCNGNDCPSTTRTGNQAGTIPAPGEAIPNAGAGAPAVPERALPEHALPGYASPDRLLPNPALSIKEEETRNVSSPLGPTEFQEFVASSVGRILPIYGYNLFDHVPSSFAPGDRIPVTSDYRIGPGDEILIRAWGQIDLDGRLVVDRSGQIFLPKVGTLTVAGLQYQQLAEYFRTAIGRVFRNFDLTVSLGQLRSIQVLVVGQARRPGTYTVSSLSTLVNALFASGGPAETGSMRRIQLKRNNAVVTEFDFYDLLVRGDQSKDVRILPGDVIYIPPVGGSIAMAGSVNVPAIYELREKLTLQDAIAMAGGLTTTADGEKAVVERIEDHGMRRVEEFLLTGPPGSQPEWDRLLKDGDVVRIFPLSPQFENSVTLRGNVARPGRVEWHSGMRLKDVIPNREALVTREYWRASNAMQNAALGRAAPEINWDYAVIQRLDRQDLTTRLVAFNLGKLELEGDERENLELEPGDAIIIFSQNDLAVPLARQSKFVRLEGEFRAAGVYRAEAGESVRHLVERVGGLTPNAYLYGAEFTRESVRAQQQKGLDRMIEQLEDDITRNTLAPAGLSPEEVADYQAKLDAQRRLVEKLRAVKATGRVVLDLVPQAAGVNELPAIAVEDGDRLVVPYRPSTIEMLGAVYNKNSFLYRRDARVEDYLQRAGGPTRDADTSRMFIIRADGSILGKQSVKGLWSGGFASLRLMPGDAVVVPERLSRGSLLKGLRDWSQVFSQFALGAAAIRIIQ
jgi:protein involved in polysaccharide export with SLBB domain